MELTTLQAMIATLQTIADAHGEGIRIYVMDRPGAASPMILPCPDCGEDRESTFTTAHIVASYFHEADPNDAADYHALVLVTYDAARVIPELAVNLDPEEEVRPAKQARGAHLHLVKPVDGTRGRDV